MSGTSDERLEDIFSGIVSEYAVTADCQQAMLLPGNEKPHVVAPVPLYVVTAEYVFTVVVPAYACFRGNPDGLPVRVVIQVPYEIMPERGAVTFFVQEYRDIVSVIPAQPAGGGEPHEAVVVLGYGIYRIVRQPVRTVQVLEPYVSVLYCPGGKSGACGAENQGYYAGHDAGPDRF